MATNIEMNILQSTGTYETLYPKTSTSNLEGTLSTSQLPSSIPASNISGTLSTSNIPNLSASKITSGTLGTARIPSLDASKITSGILSTSVGGTGTTSLSNLASNLSSYLNADSNIEVGTYYVASGEQEITFPKKPKAVIFSGGGKLNNVDYNAVFIINSYAKYVYGKVTNNTIGYTLGTNDWNENTLSLHLKDFNQPSTQYYYIVLY